MSGIFGKDIELEAVGLQFQLNKASVKTMQHWRGCTNAKPNAAVPTAECEHASAAGTMISNIWYQAYDVITNKAGCGSDWDHILWCDTYDTIVWTKIS